MADSVPAWRIVRNYNRPVTCVPQRVQAMAIDRALPHGRDNNVQFRRDAATIHRPSARADGWLGSTAARRATRYRRPCRQRQSAWMSRRRWINNVVPVKMADIDPATGRRWRIDQFRPGGGDSTRTDPVCGPAKMVAANKSARTVPVDRIVPMVDPDVPIDLVDPVIVGPTWPTVQSLVAAIVLGDRIVPAPVPAATGGRNTMAATIAPGDRMAIGDGTTTIVTITGTTIGTIIGTTTTSTIITTTGITAVGAATGRTIGTCPPPLELVPGG